jgi:hypothetical protein
MKLPPVPPKPPPGPLAKVRAQHPETGEESTFHVQHTGAEGITALDEQGKDHQIPHGHYLVHHEEPRVDPDRVAAQARRHLSLGAGAPLAVYGAIALLAHGGAKRPHALTLDDVRVRSKAVLLVPDKLRVKEPPELVDLLTRWASDADRAGGGPIFRLRGKPVEEGEVTEYVKRFGMPPPAPGGQGGQPGQPGPGGQPMAKATASALEVPKIGAPDEAWEESGYQVELRKSVAGVLLTVRHPDLPMPMHEIAPGPGRARQIAHIMVAELAAGKMPDKHGVFSPDGR